MATECIHEWGDWEVVPVWYTSTGTLKGEFRKCKKCPAAEARNLEVFERTGVLNPTIGVFAGIFNREGKLLLRRRTVDDKTYIGDWDLPGGGIPSAIAPDTLDERIILQVLGQRVKDEVGISIPSLLPMVAMYPAVLKGGGDIGFAILIGICEETPSRGETRYVSPQELRELAEGPEGNRLLSGWGKRMCRLCLLDSWRRGIVQIGNTPKRQERCLLEL